MPSEKPAQRLEDIIENAQAIQRCIAGMDLAAFEEDHKTYVVPLIWYPRLWHSMPRERDQLEIFGDGTYIHWPALDEDLTVAGLLAGRRSGESPQSLKKWLGSRKRNKPVPPTPRKSARG